MDFGWEESCTYNSWKQKAQSTLFLPTCIKRYEPSKRETMFPPVSKVNLTHFMVHELPRECPATLYKLQQRPLDIQLSADEFIYHVEKRSRIENGWEFEKAPTSFSLAGGSSSNAEDLKLCLSIGGNGNKNYFAKKTSPSYHKIIDLEQGTEINFISKKADSFHTVIDLEESDDRMTGFVTSRPSLNSPFVEVIPKAKHELQGFSLPNSVKEIRHFDIFESNYFEEHSECCREQASSSEGFKDNGDDLSSKKQQFVPSHGLFDLNKALQDDSSCCSEDPTHVCASQKSLEGGKSENSGILQQDKTVNVALLDLNINYVDKEDIWAPDFEDKSACGSVVTLASPERKTQKPSSESPCPNSLKKGNNSGASRGSYSDNDSSSGKTQHSVITSDVSDQCLLSQVAENNSRHKSSEIDIAVQDAAELLIHMSLVHSSCDIDSNANREKTEKPEYSFDSFELNTLNLTESNLDDDSASSNPVFMNNADGQDFGVKLRRGRRMKNFQKEILPSLASLSRHEILEDINIIEGALRSREYRKNRGKMVDNWSAPQRIRKPRVSKGGRRYCP